VDGHLWLFLGHLGRDGAEFLDADHHSALGCRQPALVGLLSAVPYTVGAIGMLILCRNSDRTLERHWHFVTAVFMAGVAAIAIAFSSSSAFLSIVCLAVLAVGYLSAIALFWTIPTSFLSEKEQAGGIAFISSVGQIGSLLAPVLFGYISDRTGSLAIGVAVVASVLTVGGCCVVSLKIFHRRESMRPFLSNVS
jgi:MFS transporter, ACS family, phthalate transporter